MEGAASDRKKWLQIQINLELDGNNLIIQLPRIERQHNFPSIRKVNNFFFFKGEVILKTI